MYQNDTTVDNIRHSVRSVFEFTTRIDERVATLEKHVMELGDRLDTQSEMLVSHGSRLHALEQRVWSIEPGDEVWAGRHKAPRQGEFAVLHEGETLVMDSIRRMDQAVRVLERLARLHKHGVIDGHEYQQMKADVVSDMKWRVE